MVGASMFLFLLPLVAAPVAFHLLKRRQRKTVMFSTDLFFDSMKPRLSFHRKFREPLLLLARTLLLLFLLLALARLAFPSMGNMFGLGGTQAVVVVIDNSSSMQGRAEGSDRSKLTVALEGARALLKNMDDDGQATVVLLVPDSSTAGLGGMTSDKGGLLSFLESIRATEATGDPGKALLRGMALLADASSGGGGSLHVFTDLQESEWKDTALAADDVGAADSIFLHRIPSDKPDLPNICLVRAELSMRRILPNQPYFLEVLLRNDGEQDLQVRVNRTDSEHSVAQTVTVDVGAGSQQLLKLPVQPKELGRHWIRVWIEGDGFDGDNRVFVPYICEQKGDIYFLDKDSGTFGLLPLALSPGGDGRHTSLVPAFLSPADLSARIKQNTPMLVVLTWATASSLDAPTSALLDQYTQQGGNLLLLPAVNAGESVGEVPAWLGAKQEPLTRTPVSLPLQVADRKSPLWSELRGLDGQVRIGSAFAKKYYPLSFREEAGYVPLLQTGEAQTVLAIRKYGDGQVVVSGIAFGRSGAWSSLPRKKSFLVIVQPMALGAVANVGNSSHSIVAGQTPRLMPGTGNEMSITTLLGDQVDWFGLRDQAPELVRVGAYVVSIDGRETCLTVLPSEQEGRSAFIEGSEVGALDGIRYSPQILTLANEDDFREELEQSLAGTGLFLPLLLLAFVFLIIEGLLGSPPAKLRARATDDDNKEPWVATPMDREND
ncbi:VWA domain-containing protein [Opitutales bacterium]|nr:VWA domain-containing protein [Opitutales bacterium]